VPLKNRVTPLGEVVATSSRGLVYGNRGCLHDADGRIRRQFAGKRWIACRLQFRGRHRSPLLQPGRFTELFFLDDATAFAAGHRPCALCRRADYVHFVERWRELHPRDSGADAIDVQFVDPGASDLDERDHERDEDVRHQWRRGKRGGERERQAVDRRRAGVDDDALIAERRVVCEHGRGVGGKGVLAMPACDVDQELRQGRRLHGAVHNNWCTPLSHPGA